MQTNAFCIQLRCYRLRESLYKYIRRNECHSEAVRSTISRIPTSMSAWQVISFENGGKVELVRNLPIPIISDPHHVLVKVKTASINPLDIEMMHGFGHVLLKNMRFISSLCHTNEGSYKLPLTLGRDFAGVVVSKGSSVNSVQVGDEVFGVTKPEYNGCHAEYTLAMDSLVIKKPKTLSMEKASAILYTSITAWSALKISGFPCFSGQEKCEDVPILVIGASGGVGQAAVQLLKAWKFHVVATCRTDAVPFVQKLSPDLIIDYTSSDYLSQIEKACSTKYSVILDAAGLPNNELNKFCPVLRKHGILITLRSPLLNNIDKFGLLGGCLQTLGNLWCANMSFSSSVFNVKFRYGFFTPVAAAVNEISQLVENDKLIPQIEKVYAFSDALEAYSRMKAGHLRGKIVLSMD